VQIVVGIEYDQTREVRVSEEVCYDWPLPLAGTAPLCGHLKYDGLPSILRSLECCCIEGNAVGCMGFAASEGCNKQSSQDGAAINFHRVVPQFF
jgi:hypothetical protein